MIKPRLTVISRLLLCVGVLAQPIVKGASPEALSEQMLSERKHFADCLAAVYDPAFWISYNGCLCFQPKTEDQVRQLEAMQAARSKYVALTNRQTRHEIAARGIAASGIDQRWQQKILLPFSPTNQDLTPTLRKPFRHIPQYKLLQTLPRGDALIQDGATTCFVMDFGRGTDDSRGTNACLIREGVKTYSEGGSLKTVEAFENVSLGSEEKAVLTRVAAAFRREAAAFTQQAAASQVPAVAPETVTPKAREEFEDGKARATDTNPHMEYLLARCYLEGKGTERNEALGMEWMTRAAKSGSGDAISYLEKTGRKGP
jgi:TPR repeat protein